MKELKSLKKQGMVDIYTEINWIKLVLKVKVDMENTNTIVFSKNTIL